MNGPGRLLRLRAAMEEQALDAVAMVPGANLYYLTGAHST
jgi:Xaa-Pro aminopeptidase